MFLKANKKKNKTNKESSMDATTTGMQAERRTVMSFDIVKALEQAMNYKSPIEMFESTIEMQIEDEAYRAVQRVGFNVDKDELKKALEYDRHQYEKGFKDGLNSDKWIPCSERLPEKPEVGEDSYIVQESDIVLPFSAYWDGECWTDINGEVYEKILAWRPLPERYKPNICGNTDCPHNNGNYCPAWNGCGGYQPKEEQKNE